MRNLKKSILMLTILFSVISSSFAQDKAEKIQTVEFQVMGVCQMCEERIEDAALIKGVKMAEWDLETGQIKVVFVSKKVSEMEIHEAIAGAGHDTDKLNASDKAAGNLPECCRYRDGVQKH